MNRIEVTHLIAVPAAVPVPTRRRLLCRGLLLAVGGAALTVLAGCAGLQQVTVEVSTFGAWPSGRAAGRYAFERLPSQQQDAGADAQARLEAAASAALERVGFTLASDPARADVLVQFGSRQAQVLTPPPRVSIGIGIGTGFGGGFGRHGGIGLGMGMGSGWYGSDRLRERTELGLLLLDRASHQVLVEVQARNDSRYGADDLPEAMFDAALQGFPDLVAGTRSVTVPLPSSGR
jgi:Domain of unknown function (DUF4136)